MFKVLQNNRDSAWRVITKLGWLLGKYEPLSHSAKELHAHPLSHISIERRIFSLKFLPLYFCNFWAWQKYKKATINLKNYICNERLYINFFIITNSGWNRFQIRIGDCQFAYVESGGIRIHSSDYYGNFTLNSNLPCQEMKQDY